MSSEEHKTYYKASRWGHSRAATGRGAGRARCGLHEHGRQQEQAPTDMRTGQSAQACRRREVSTDHEAHSQTLRRQLRRVATTELRPSARADQSRTATKSRSNQALETRTSTHRAGKERRAGLFSPADRAQRAKVRAEEQRVGQHASSSCQDLT